MGLKATLAGLVAPLVSKMIDYESSRALKHQKKIMQELLLFSLDTKFGEEHGFRHITSYEDFKRHVPLRTYEDFLPYIRAIQSGEQDVLWQGEPLYRAETSGTTAGKKYIPITQSSLNQQIRAARNALLRYIARTGNTHVVDGKMIFIQGSPVLKKIGNIQGGRLSGIVANHVPYYFQKNRLPSFETNSIEDRQKKEEEIVNETIHQDMRLISGIPPWLQSYFDKLLEKSNKNTVSELFENLSLIIRGGVNFEPYKEKFFKTLGKEIDMLETYPASEGFFAYQDGAPGEGLLLNTNAGIFYEFVPLTNNDNIHQQRIALQDVELNTNYILIVSTNAGLWAYNTGDTIKFVHKDPYRIVVTGRVKHYISAFGEHVIAEEIDNTIIAAQKEFPGVVINEFSVAPYVSTQEGVDSHYQWYIEFNQQSIPDDMQAFARCLDKKLAEQNPYYQDLITGTSLVESVIKQVKPGGFKAYATQSGKLGSQNKVVRLSNDRKYVSGLDQYLVE